MRSTAAVERPNSVAYDVRSTKRLTTSVATSRTQHGADRLIVANAGIAHKRAAACS